MSFFDFLSVDFWNYLGSFFGMAGAVILTVPALSSLRNRESYERARDNFKNSIIDEKAFAAARTTYMNSVLGDYKTNRTLSIAGLLCVFLAFFMPLLPKLSGFMLLAVLMAAVFLTAICLKKVV